MGSFLKRLFGGSVKSSAPVVPNVSSTRPSTIDSATSVGPTEPMPETGQPQQAAFSASEFASMPSVNSTEAARSNADRTTAQPSDEQFTTRYGGVFINGTVTVSGDIVGRDRVVVVSYGTIDQLFDSLLSEVQAIESETLRAEARQHIIEIREQARCFESDLVVVGNALKWLAVNTPNLVAKLREVLANQCIPRSLRDMTIVILGSDA